MSYICGESRAQRIMLPDYLDEYVSEENPVRVFDAFVDSLDMEACGFQRYVPAKEGRPGYDPRDLLKLYIYGYFNKVRSSRSLSKETKRNLEVMWLINKLMPDFRTISDFRKDNARALKEVFRAFNRLCDSLKLYSKECISIDGSKFRAVNAKDKNFTLSKLDDRLKRLDNQIDEYMLLMEKTDSEESDERSFTREEIESRIESLKKRRDTYTSYRAELEESGDSQKSLTDPQSKLMKFPYGYGVGYNVQAAVDSANHLIAGFEVTNHPTDHGLLEPVASGVKADFELEIIETIADKGYRSSSDLISCLEAGIVPNVYPSDGEEVIELETDYERSDVTPEIKSSHAPEDIKKCLRSGVIPEVYEGIISEIAVKEKASFARASDHEDCVDLSEEEMLGLAKEGFFIRDIEQNRVYCPQGQILRQKCVNRNGSIRYYNKLACKKCLNKCTKAAFKEADFIDGQISAISLALGSREAFKKKLKKRFSAQKQYQKVVKIKLKPDKRKLAERKCLSEHPFGTVKHALGASYFLLKGIEKASAEISLAFLSYNLIRAMNLLGVPKLMKVLT